MSKVKGFIIICYWIRDMGLWLIRKIQITFCIGTKKKKDKMINFVQVIFSMPMPKYLGDLIKITFENPVLEI